MKQLTYLLKSSRWIYTIYYIVFSALFKILGCFIRIDPKLILFNSFGGRKYDDSPKAIYEVMKTDIEFWDYKLVWALDDPAAENLPKDLIAVKNNSFQFFVMALKARCWITNSSMERGLSFKKKKTFCLNTWHGSAMKKVGSDIQKENMSFGKKGSMNCDAILAQSKNDIFFYSRAFNLNETTFFNTGLPRNDILRNHSSSDRAAIRKKLNIPDGKTVILYAPTFREYEKGAQNECCLEIPMNLGKWQKELGNQYVVLFRAHYEVAKHMDVSGYPLFVDVSSYPHLNDLMIASDLLVSDYSSIFFDYSIMHKPMYCFAYDYDQYVEHRGLYFDLEEELPCRINRCEDDLIQDLFAYFDEEKRNQNIASVVEFQKKYVTWCGMASKAACDLIAEKLGGFDGNAAEQRLKTKQDD